MVLTQESFDSFHEMEQRISDLCTSIHNSLREKDTFNLRYEISIESIDPYWDYSSPDDDSQEGSQEGDDENRNEQLVEESSHLGSSGFFASSTSRERQYAEKFMQVFRFILSKNYQFKEIIFDHNNNLEITDEHIKLMHGHYNQLNSFCIYDFDDGISSSVLSEFFQGRHSLTQITLRRCSQVDDDVVRAIADNCPNLQYLNITGVKNVIGRVVSDESIVYLATKCRDLKYIYLKRQGISDVAVNKLSECCPRLQEINLVDCNGVTDQGIETLLSNCQLLTRISLGGGAPAKLTQRSLNAIANSHIEYLELDSFADISHDDREQSRGIFKDFIMNAGALTYIKMNFTCFNLGFTSIIHNNQQQPIEMCYSDTGTLSDAQILRAIEEEANNKPLSYPNPI